MKALMSDEVIQGKIIKTSIKDLKLQKLMEMNLKVTSNRDRKSTT